MTYECIIVRAMATVSDEELAEKLNALGEEDWRIVATTYDESVSLTRVFLQREKQIHPMLRRKQ